ncbi:MAG TPA: PEGA domain-containing protein [Phycisphaerae bacterium]|jgi:hypothetical protein|nr:PEGA domain-containing protein [Phycisphaerae bacterium]
MIRASHCLLLALAPALLAGCVERKVTIGSDPSGALVELNGVQVGRTPLTVPITWQGDYELYFRYEKNVGTPTEPKIVRYYLHTHKRTTTPWFETIGVDLFAEILPIPFKQEEIWAFPVPEVTEPADDDLIKRARAMKDQLESSRVPGSSAPANK